VPEIGREGEKKVRKGGRRGTIKRDWKGREANTGTVGLRERSDSRSGDEQQYQWRGNRPKHTPTPQPNGSKLTIWGSSLGKKHPGILFREFKALMPRPIVD